jgi:sulfite exporter TauE/SafE
MMALAAGLLLGLAGGAHCLGMCGPFVLFMGAAPSAGRARMWRHTLLHHGGRISVYVILGGLAGMTGGSIAGAGFRNALALAAGAALVVQALGLTARAVGARPGRALTAVIGRLGSLARALPPQHPGRPILLGALNGLLPCGLLYAALAAAAGLGDVGGAVRFTLAFGIGSLPVFALLAYSAHAFIPRVPLRLRRAAPVALAVVGLMLIARGLAAPVAHHAMMIH